MATVKMNASEVRKPEHAIDKLFLDRWSPRALSGEPITDKELLGLFEAAFFAQLWLNSTRRLKKSGQFSVSRRA